MIDLDEFAKSLGVTTESLKDSLMELGLSCVENEAARLNHGEHFATKSFPVNPAQDRHLIAAAKSMLTTR